MKLDVIWALQRKDAVVIDVRQPQEINDSGIIKGRGWWFNAPCTLDGCPTLEIFLQAFEKNTPVLLYCASGKRAGIAKQLIVKQGFNNVITAKYDDLKMYRY